MKGAGRIRKAFHVVRRQFKPGGVILLYHRIVELPSDPLSLAVSPARFAQHLEYIQRTCHPMHLLDLTEAMRESSLPQRAVAITFDDGYSDNFKHAYPLLQSAGIPATIFVSSEQVDSEYEFWWDELERVLLLPKRLPDHLRISVEGQENEWQIGSIEQRQRAYRALHALLRPLDAQARGQVLDELRSWANLEPAGRPDYLAVSAAELTELAQSECIEIGGHTMTHPVLSALPVNAQRAEVVGGHQRLEVLIGGPVLAFAYPYGTAQDFTDETAEVVRAAGFHAACTTIHGSVESGDDPMRLRRCAVFDWDLSTFTNQLESFFTTRS